MQLLLGGATRRAAAASTGRTAVPSSFTYCADHEARLVNLFFRYVGIHFQKVALKVSLEGIFGT